MEDDDTKVRRNLMLDPQRIQNAEYLRRDWVCTAEEGTTVDDILAPSYWCHIASQMGIYDRIEVRIDTGEFMLELLVKEVGRNWAQVVILHEHDLTSKVDAEAVTDAYEAKFKGSLLKWCVIRKQDNQILQDKLEGKPAALAWIDTYQRTIVGR